MTTEEKARAYDEALERAKNALRTDLHESGVRAIQRIFPQLAESEDERIRKALIKLMTVAGESYVMSATGFEKERLLAYLEKQKEKEKYDRMQPVYDNLDSFESALAKAWKAYNDSGSRTVDGCEDDYVECAHAKGFREGYLFGLERQKEQKPSPRFHPCDWVVYDGPLGHAILQVKDVVDGRYTFVDNESTLLVEDSDKFLHPLTQKDVEKKVEWSDEDEEMIDCIIDDIREAKRTSDKEYFKELCDKEMDWLKSLRPQPVAEWSEEDERIRKAILGFLNPDKGGTKYSSNAELVEWSDWLKSLRPSWKPTEEQMSALERTTRLANFGLEEDRRKALVSLYEQLKKL